MQQYNRHLRHVVPYIGGVLYTEVRQGDDTLPYVYLDKATQRKALKWVLSQARTYRDWLTPADLLQRIGANVNYASSIHRTLPASLIKPATLFRIREGGAIDPVKNYTVESYLNDVIAEVFKATYQGRKLNDVERDLQSETIELLIQYSDLQGTPVKVNLGTLTDDVDLEGIPFPCSHVLAHQAEEQSFTRFTLGPSMSVAEMAPYMSGALKKVLTLYKQKRAVTTDAATRDFYDYQIVTIEKLFNN